MNERLASEEERRVCFIEEFQAPVGIEIARWRLRTATGACGGIDQAIERVGIVQPIATQIDPGVQEKERATRIGAVKQHRNDGEGFFVGLAIESETDLGPLPIADLCADEYRDCGGPS